MTLLSTTPLMSRDINYGPSELGRGHPLGLTDDPHTDWYLSVEVQGISAIGVLGQGQLSDDNGQGWTNVPLMLGSSQEGGWTDISDDVRGLDWVRGADEPYGRPVIGELAMTLDNTEGRFSPWPSSGNNISSAYWAPGTVLRISVSSPGDPAFGGWLPQFTGIVDSWEQVASGVGADNFVAVRAYETLRWVSNIDDNIAAPAAGAGESAGARIQRLLDPTDWPFGYTIEAENHLANSSRYGLQETNLSMNRLQEVYLTSDSSDVAIRSGRDGSCYVYDRYSFGAVGMVYPTAETWPLMEHSYKGLNNGRTPAPCIGFDWDEHRETKGDSDILYAPYDADSFITGNDDAYVFNDVRLARVEGTQKVAEQTYSISRYGRKTFTRSDLICQRDDLVEDMAKDKGERQGLNTLRAESFSISTSHRSPDVFKALIAMDVGCMTEVYAPAPSQDMDRPHIEGFIRGFRHRITSMGNTVSGIDWDTSVTVDTDKVIGLTPAQLDPGPYN